MGGGGFGFDIVWERYVWGCCPGETGSWFGSEVVRAKKMGAYFEAIHFWKYLHLIKGRMKIEMEKENEEMESFMYRTNHAKTAQ